MPDKEKMSTPGSFFYWLLSTKKIIGIVYGGLFLLTLILLFSLIFHHYQIISAKVPLDYYEGTMPIITGIIAEGKNPYSFELQPIYTDVYPPLYNLIAAPLTLAFGNSLALHRMVSGFFIAGIYALTFIATLRASKSPLLSFCASTAFYASCLFYSTPIASTNSTGLFFFLASIIIPWLNNFSNRSLAVAIVCGFFAFYSKQYFIAGLGYVGCYLLLSVSIKKSLIFGISSTIVILLSLVIVHKTSPYFLDNTIFAVSAATGYASSYKYMLQQMLVFSETYASLLILLVLIAIKNAKDNKKGKTIKIHKNRELLNFRNINKPLTNLTINYFFFCFILSTLIVGISLGKNPGNWMTYFHQLMSPFLLIFGFTMIATSRITYLISIPFIIFLFHQVYSILPKDFSTDLSKWQKVNNYIDNSEHVFSSTILTMSLLDRGKVIYQNGQTFYFPLAEKKPDFLKKDNEAERITSIWKNYMGMIYNKIENQMFDVIILNYWDINGIFAPNPPSNSEMDGIEFLKRYYRLEESITVSMTDRHGGRNSTLNIWLPKNSLKKEKKTSDETTNPD